ncbi:MAG: ATP-binding protein [bacterium]|nr:ATP-binding protein [bacterium]
MYELALFMLDLVQNALTAGATYIKIWLDEDFTRNRLTLTIADNGCGMAPHTLTRALDPFMTTKTSRRKSIGLGLPFFRQLVESCGGGFKIKSRPGCGTVITGWYPLDNVDQPPLGDWNETLRALIQANPHVRFYCAHRRNQRCVTFDTLPVRRALGPHADALWQSADMTTWFREQLSAS